MHLLHAGAATATSPPAPVRVSSRAMPRSPKARPAPLDAVLERLHAHYPEARCSLEHTSPLQLLVATILSAQCTDSRVNQVTPGLFRRFPDARALADAPAGTLEEEIRSTGFFNAKARSIRAAARRLVDAHGGEVPRSMEALHALPGVGRKTANVVLGNAFGTPDGVVVDTHVGRLARRLGWSRQSDPEKVEADLNRAVPREEWVYLSHSLIEHGRAVCTARKPACARCPFEDLCPKAGVTTEPAPDPTTNRRNR